MEGWNRPRRFTEGRLKIGGRRRVCDEERREEGRVEREREREKEGN